MAKTALVDLRVWGLILIGRHTSECGLLKLVGVLLQEIDRQPLKFQKGIAWRVGFGGLSNSYCLQWRRLRLRRPLRLPV